MPRRASATGRAVEVAKMSAGVTGSYLGYLAQHLFLGKPAREEKLKATHSAAAKRVSDRMVELKGPLMKLGQTLSMHGDILPTETLAELSRLQMSAPGMHPSLVRAQFRAVMGKEPEDVYAAFEERPFAAASLGQVHRARTREGEDVAVKIQYPGVRDAIAGDFQWFRSAMLPMRLTKLVPSAVIDELQEQIAAETDYEREAANLELFARKLAPLGYVDVPRPARKYSKKNVLTMSLLEGEHLDAFLARKPSQTLRDLVGSRLLEMYFFQVLRMGALHGDPHWGNYLFRADGSIGLVDFGCVKVLPPAFVENLRKVFLFAGPRNSPEFMQLMKERYSTRGAKLAPVTQRALTHITENFYARVFPPEPAHDSRSFDFSDEAFLHTYMKEASILFRAKGTLPEYVILGRAEMGLYQTLHKLRARVRTSEIVRTHIAP